MPIAYVMINAEVGKIKQVLNELKKIEGVTEAYAVAGPYDIIAKLQAEKFEKVANGVTKGIHKIDGIKNTLTLFAFE